MPKIMLKKEVETEGFSLTGVLFYVQR